MSGASRNAVMCRLMIVSRRVGDYVRQTHGDPSDGKFRWGKSKPDRLAEPDLQHLDAASR